MVSGLTLMPKNDEIWKFSTQINSHVGNESIKVLSQSHRHPPQLLCHR